MPFLKDLKIERVEGELAVALSKSYPKRIKGFAKIGEKKWFLPYKYVEQGDEILIFILRLVPMTRGSLPILDHVSYFLFLIVFLYTLFLEKKYLICLLLVMYL